MKKVGIYLDVSTGGGRHIFQGIADYARVVGDWELSADIYSQRLGEASQFDGVIATFVTGEKEAKFDCPDIKLVNVLTRSEVPSVLPDEQAVGRMVAAHFLESGFANYGFFSPFHHATFSIERYAGFKEALEKAGQTCSSHLEVAMTWRDGSSEKMVSDLTAWLDSQEKPIAVMTSNDTASRFVVEACRTLGLSVPDDVAVVGVDNDELLCQTCLPPLSSIALAHNRIGYHAARMLDTLMNGEQLTNTTHLVPPLDVVSRQSSDTLAVADDLVAQAVRYIRLHAHEPIGVEDILDQVHVSRRTLERRFSELLNRSPHQELVRTRMQKAKLLLVSTDQPITTVALASGYASVTRFGIAFKQETSLTPSEYRHRFTKS